MLLKKKTYSVTQMPLFWFLSIKISNYSPFSMKWIIAPGIMYTSCTGALLQGMKEKDWKMAVINSRRPL